MNINKCIISGILCQPPELFSNQYGNFLELRINQTEEFISDTGLKITSVIQFVILYFGKLKDKLVALTTGQRVYIEGNMMTGQTVQHSVSSVILSKTIHPLN
jgi:hypothetical protein